MKITYTEETQKTVDLTEKQMLKITIATLEKHFNLKRGDRVRDGKLEREIEYHAHRAYWDWEKQRDAKISDEIALGLIRDLFERKQNV